MPRFGVARSSLSTSTNSLGILPTSRRDSVRIDKKPHEMHRAPVLSMSGSIYQGFPFGPGCCATGRCSDGNSVTLPSVTPYKFLIDHDVEKVAAQLSRKRVLTLEKVGLPDEADDKDILRTAWERRCRIVTANGKDFLPAMQRFLSQTQIRVCHDLFGLVVLPGGCLGPRLLRATSKGWRCGCEAAAEVPIL